MSGTLGTGQDRKKAFVPVAAIIAGGLANSCLSILDMVIDSPFFFDSIFTAVSGALFGPWAGFLCALATHLFLTAFHGGDVQWLYFLPCSMATGVITGVFAARRDVKETTTAVSCIVCVTLANSLIGAIISAYAYGGMTTHPSDSLVSGLIFAGQSIFAASFLGRILLNLVDKGLAVGVAFVTLRLFRDE